MKIRSVRNGIIIYEDDSETMKETFINAVKSGSDLSGSDLSGSDLRGSNLSGSDLRGSNLSGSDLSGSDGLKYAQISFLGFGERNRLISLIDINRDGNPIFFCGCLIGTNEELIEYIENGDEGLKESRHFARKTLLEAIKFSNNNKNN